MGILQALERDLVLHRVLAVHDRDSDGVQSPREVAAALHGNQRVVRSVLQQHGHGSYGPGAEAEGVHPRQEGAHREHREGALRGFAAQREGEHQACAL